MIKKLLIVLLLMCFSFCFGASIPVEKRAQYKAEVEAYAIKKFPEIKKEADKEFQEAQELYGRYKAARNEQKRDNLITELEHKSSSRVQFFAPNHANI